MIDEFYSTPSINDWKKVTGNDLHYHHGYYETGDEDQILAQQKAIRRLYSYIGKGSSVIDLGCGWMSTGKLLAEENSNAVKGITISKQQAEYSTNVDLLNLENIEASDIDKYDVAIMIESIEHIFNINRLFNILKNKVDKIIICSSMSFKNYFNKNVFGNTCKPHTLPKVINSLEKNNFCINKVQNYRHKSLKSYEHWLTGLNKGVSSSSQFDALFNYCNNFKDNIKLQKQLPLYLIVAKQETINET